MEVYDHPTKRPKLDPQQPISVVNQPTGRIFFKTRLCAKFRMGQCRNGENCNFAHGEEDLRKPPPNWQELVGGGEITRGSNNIFTNFSNNADNPWGDRDRDRDRDRDGNCDEDGNNSRMIQKMRLCEKFYNGEECSYGARCRFLHKDGPGKVVAFRESSAISIGTTGGPPMRGPMMGGIQQSVADQYEVNRMMMMNGNGNGNGNGGGTEGGMMGRGTHRVYWRTKLCTKFETTGHCSFGDTCHFAHGHSELLLPGGRPVDSEPATMSNVSVKSVPLVASDPTPTQIETVAPSSQEGQGNKCILKWKGTKKINRIYGDWIDDLPLNLPNEVEC